MKKLFSILPLFTCLTSYAQLVVTPVHPTNNTLEDMVLSLVGAGVQITNITSNLPQTSPAYGSFEDTTGTFGIQKGILLTSGWAVNAPGPNFSGGETGANFTPGDANLTTFAGGPTFDACVIEFDITPTVDTIVFNYIFGSEEYPEYSCSGFNDVFAFLISGPGITGQQNLAQLPGLGIPVTINNVNGGDPGNFTCSPNNDQFFVSNYDAFGFPNGSQNIEYDGYTVKLEAKIAVTPCETYHLKLAIADVGDEVLDSGVFIEGGSLGASKSIAVDSLIGVDSVNVCATNLPDLQAGNEPAATYEWFFENNPIPGGNGQTQPIIGEGKYNVIVTLAPGCFWEDSLDILIFNDFTMTASNDTTLCYGDSVYLRSYPSGGSNYTYSWTPSSTVIDPDSAMTYAVPQDTTEYVIRVISNSACIQRDTVLVNVIPFIDLATNFNDSIICLGDSVLLEVTGGQTYQWTPSTILNDTTIYNPYALPSMNDTIWVYSQNSCFSDSEFVFLEVRDRTTATDNPDSTICLGESVQLSTDTNEYYSYTWTPSTGLSGTNIPDPLATPDDSMVYILSVFNGGCYAYDTVAINVLPNVEAGIIKPKFNNIVPFDMTLLNGSAGASQYIWVVNQDSAQTVDFTYNYTEEGYYEVILTAANALGCIDYDTIVFKAIRLDLPNIITPNGDNINDSFEITGLGEHFNLIITNRWGEVVYSKDAYKNEWSAEGLSDGTYFYALTDAKTGEKYNGWILVIR